MEIEKTGKIQVQAAGVANRERPQATRFSGVLAARLAEQTGGAAPPLPGAPAPAGAAGGRIALGVISAEQPTVSHLLRDHPELGREAWRIIHAEVNRGKPFTRMMPGTRVELDPETGELFWEARPERGKTEPPPAAGSTGGSPGQAMPAAGVLEAAPVALGAISQALPTVSHLLWADPVFGPRTWEILGAAENRDKPFTRIRPGTRITIDPATLEIFWPAPACPGPSPSAVAGAVAPAEESPAGPEDGDFSASLVQAVERYLGRPYEEVDCYGLLVRGLEALGVRYQGRDGLFDRLVARAEASGLPRNAFLNGEGLIAEAGGEVYARSAARVRDADREAREVFREMEPVLAEGMILSFSTPTRGHTGVVSKRDGAWTYINSGAMDHALGETGSGKRVGEEFLLEELRNWLDLAGRRRESLRITVGSLREERLPGRSRQPG